MAIISAKRFFEIINSANEIEDQTQFLAEYGFPGWLPEEVTDDDDNRAIELLQQIHTVTHMTPAELVEASVGSQTKFAARFGIPLRTVQNWCRGAAAMPFYTKLMAAQLLGLLGDLEIVA